MFCAGNVPYSFAWVFPSPRPFNYFHAFTVNLQNCLLFYKGFALPTPGLCSIFLATPFCYILFLCACFVSRTSGLCIAIPSRVPFCFNTLSCSLQLICYFLCVLCLMSIRLFIAIRSRRVLFGFNALRLDLTNRKWFSVVHSLIDNDTRQHSGQNVVDSQGAATISKKRNLYLDN